MGINIDSFLEGIEGEKKQEAQIKESGVEEKVDLSFEEGVKSKITALQKSVGEKDFDFLVKAYNEMKSFDETLPNKLFSINEVSGKALTEISSRYSKSYLDGISNNMKTLSASIQNNLNRAHKELDVNNFQMAMTCFNEAQKSFAIFPKEFVSEKTEVGRELRNLEIKINERFLVYKRDEVKRVKLQLSQELKGLRDSLIPGNISQIEQKIDSIIGLMDKTPKVFYSDLVLERTQVSKMMITAQDFLKKEYERDFEGKKKEIFALFDKFHRYRTTGDANSALITYDEMIILFGKMPDIFLEEKTQIFDRINKVFESLNNLLMSSNMSVFVKTYEYGKVLDEVRDYIDHVSITKSADLNVLIDLKKRIGEIPISFKPEVVEMITTLDKMISNFEKAPKTRPILRATRKVKEDPIPSPEMPEIDKVEMEKDLVTPSTSKKDNVKSNIVLEVNECYKSLIAAKDRNEAVRYAKKINFYVDMLKASEGMKKEILAKVERALKSK